MTTLVSTPFFFLHNTKQNTNNNKNNNNKIYTFGKGINRENDKDHIFQSRGSALDHEEHIVEWRIALEGPHYAIMKNGSKLIGGGCTNENAIHGAPKKGQGWRIALEGPH